MENKHLSVTEQDKVAWVWLNRQDKGNSLSPEVLEEIEATFSRLSAREDIHVLVFTGGERFFSVGFDLDEIKQVEKGSNEEFISLFHRAYKSIMFCSQPVICAVGGPAFAGGFDLTMMCDIRYASERAQFSQRELALSLTPVMDPLWRIIGLGRAKEVALSGRIYDAYEAERMGYVSKIFSQDELLDSVDKIARDMASFDRTCLSETKQLTHMVLDQDLNGSMRYHEWLFRSYLGSEDNRSRIESLQEQLAKKKKK